MPIVQNRRIEVILNPYSTINRKIPSVISEIALGNIATTIHANVEALKKNAAGRKKAKALVDKYYEGRYANMTPDEFINFHNSQPFEEVYHFNVGCFSDFTPEKIQSWMDELGVTTQYEAMMPESELTDLKELKEVLSPEEYEKTVKEMQGKFIKVEKPLMTGQVYLERLYHQPQYSNKVTTDMNDVRDKDPISGRGFYRGGGGQKIGEMELSALLGRHAKGFIKKSREDIELEQNQIFLDNLLGLGLMVTDEKGYPQGGSNLKSSMNKLKTKYRMKGGLN